ncbi:unnamed protein product [Cylicocyclus nassatus]|uniref:Myb-like domain-containing protein n=1 Tax=Cylicocyclus nassatus TaxID=53992 RepID=A0AA36DLN6_CYLNA|nr:unnamed protein product [Cylicocyclus nassatus]
MPEYKKRLPESGLYNDDGYLFHHTSGQPLTREEIERLRQHDIPYEKRCRFNPAEDEQIRKNWKRFAAKHNLEYEKAPGYAGVPGYKIFADNEERATFNRTTAFWPHICHNLPHRSAAQIRRRIGIIFDPAVIEGKAEITYSRNVPWTDKQTKKLLRYYMKYGMSTEAVHKIGKLLNRPAHSCQNQLRNSLARRGPVPNHLRKKLWGAVMKYTDDQEKPFKRLVRKAIYHKQYENVQDYDKRTEWNTVAQRMVYPIERVKEAWLHLLKDLQHNYVKQRECRESRKKSWSTALNAVSLEIQQTPEDTMYEILTRKLYNCEFLTSNLREKGVTGFYSGGSSELNYLFRKTRVILWRLHHLLFRRLKLPFTLKERLHVLSMAYDYQCGFEDGQQIARPKQFERLKLTTGGFPAIHRTPFIEALVVYSIAKFEDWIAPTVLKKYVVSEEVLALFPKERNNSEIIKQKDLKTAVSFIDLDDHFDR